LKYWNTAIQPVLKVTEQNYHNSNKTKDYQLMLKI
jgi:hypothetical protein